MNTFMLAGLLLVLGTVLPYFTFHGPSQAFLDFAGFAAGDAFFQNTHSMLLAGWSTLTIVGLWGLMVAVSGLLVIVLGRPARVMVAGSAVVLALLCTVNLLVRALLHLRAQDALRAAQAQGLGFQASDLPGLQAGFGFWVHLIGVLLLLVGMVQASLGKRAGNVRDVKPLR